MAERASCEYKRLFEIHLLHHYWLDEGATVFDLIADQEEKNRRLLSYDRRAFLALTPTTTTISAFRGLGCIYKDTALGGIVAVSDTTVIPADAVFEFAVTVSDPALYNYTALTLRSQRLCEIYHKPDEKLFRYKENVPLLANDTGVARGSGSSKLLYLSKEFPALSNEDKAEALVIEDGALMQLTGDQPGAGKQLLNFDAQKLPVYIHQGDVPPIVPPSGLVGAPMAGIPLTGDIPENVWALIRLTAVRSDDGDFSFIDGEGHAKDQYPVFQVRLKNRSTLWKYFNRNTGSDISVEAQPLPLTHLGNAGTKQKPSGGLVKPEKIDNKVERLVSEVFV